MTSGGSVWGAVRWAFALTFGRRAFSTIFTFVLAALLGPHDFGLVAMALIYITLLRLIMEQGVATALVQRAETEPEHWDTAFWLNVAWCLLLTGVGIATSGLWASLNGEPDLKPVVQVLSLLVIAEGLHMVQEAVLQRELSFKRLAIRSNVAAVLGGRDGPRAGPERRGRVGARGAAARDRVLVRRPDLGDERLASAPALLRAACARAASVLLRGLPLATSAGSSASAPTRC